MCTQSARCMSTILRTSPIRSHSNAHTHARTHRNTHTHTPTPISTRTRTEPTHTGAHRTDTRTAATRFFWISSMCQIYCATSRTRAYTPKSIKGRQSSGKRPCTNCRYAALCICYTNCRYAACITYTQGKRLCTTVYLQVHHTPARARVSGKLGARLELGAGLDD